MKFLNLLKIRLIFNILFLNICKQTFHISQRFNVKSSAYYFHMKTRLSADFPICIGIPLKEIRFPTAVNESKLDLTIQHLTS